MIEILITITILGPTIVGILGTNSRLIVVISIN